MTPPRTRARLALAAALCALAYVAGVALMGTSAWLIARAAQHPAASTLSLAAVAVRALALARALLRYGERLVGHDVVLRLAADLRVSAFAALRRSPARDGVGADVSLLVSDVDSLQDLWLRFFLPYGSAVLVSAATAATVWVVLPSAGWLVLVSQGLALLALPAVAWLSGAKDQLLAARRAEHQAAVVDLLHGAAELLVHGGTALALHRAERAAAQVARLERAAARRSALLGALVTALQGSATVGVAVLGSRAVRSGHLEPVMFAVVVLVTLASFEPVAASTEGTGLLRRALAARQRVRALVEATGPGPDDPAPSPALPPRGAVVVDRVGHRFPERRRAALDLREVPITLTPGTSLAIVGGSGAGKSTLLRLLAGDLAPSEGSVSVSGSPLESLSSEHRAAVAVLAAQDAHVFDTSVADNLRVGRPDASDAELLEVLTVVGLEPWLAGLDQGLGTALGHRGVRMSGGERKRLCVARALLSHAPLLLLDEPTEGLEPDAADALVRQVLLAAKDRAVVLVSHRVAALDAVDDVLVLDRGRLVARGRAEELRDAPGLFAEAWHLQSGALVAAPG